LHSSRCDARLIFPPHRALKELKYIIKLNFTLPLEIVRVEILERHFENFSVLPNFAYLSKNFLSFASSRSSAKIFSSSEREAEKVLLSFDS
jgi:hypothetical protein